MLTLEPAGASLGGREQWIDAHVDRVVVMATAGSRCRDRAVSGGVCDGHRAVVDMMAMPQVVMVAVAAEVDMQAASMLVVRRAVAGFVEMRHRGRMEQQVSDKTQECRRASECHGRKCNAGRPASPRPAWPEE